MVALALVAVALGVARWWSFDAGTGPELEASFELGPLGPDRAVTQTLRSDTDDLAGVQLLARALGTVEPVRVSAALYADGKLIASTALHVFPSEHLQPVRALFADPGGPGQLQLTLRMDAEQSGAVAYGATRGDRYPVGTLALDGQVRHEDQDLSLRQVHRRTSWRGLELLAAAGPAGPIVAAVATATASIGLALALLAGASAVRAPRRQT